MDAVCLSLGHNSSAILIRDGKILGGYETERLTKVKGDSTFPMLPIIELHKRFTISQDVEFMIGHWALDGKVNSMVKKHWNPEFLKINWPKCTIQSLDAKTFTHHDSHAYSALAFAGPEFPQEESYIAVMDGFGTMGEHMSIYKLYDNVPVLQWRKHGFGTSMGLLYQYTTAYLGMKQNQDEYKLLAFESLIEDAKTYIDSKTLTSQIRKWSEYFSQEISRFDTDPKTDPMISIGALPAFAKQVCDIHDSVLDALGLVNPPDNIKKIIIAYFTQSVVEDVVAKVLLEYNAQNWILAGGLFYNVKLNSMISRITPGKLCIMPLAGDQGAALGLYHAKYGLGWPGHLFWGHRDMSEVIKGNLPPTVMVAKNLDDGLALVESVLDARGYVNLVRGAMEFGPRALCHTSTLALANIGIGQHINKINGRVNEMPFAPVISPGKAAKLFENIDKIWRSLEYMIVTRDYTEDHGERYRDAAHLDVNRGVYTGRPQIATEPEMVRMLRNHDLLINTSFNFHGVPIVYGWEDVLHTHNEECKLAGGRPPTTVVITGE